MYVLNMVPFLCVDSDLRLLFFKSHTTHLENVMMFSRLNFNDSFHKS